MDGPLWAWIAVLGAIVALLDRFHWILYVFGGFLVLTGIKMLYQRAQHADPMRSRTLRVLRRVLPTTDQYDGQRFRVRQGTRWVATPLFVVLVLVEVTDILFAVDSIPAILAVTQEPILVFTSNAFAILGLRAMYFLLADLMHRFVHLKVGLAPTLHNVDHLSARDVVSLVASAGWPSVTLVLDTTVADRMTQRDAARPSGLVDEAGRRLAARAPLSGAT